MSQLIDFVLHIDNHMINIVNTFGGWTYGILFLIIFVETGAVILPFLPGDSLLFAAAALAANPNYHLSIWLFIGIFLLAAIGGDSTNFFIGRRVGIALTRHRFFGKFIKEKNLTDARHFFEKHGMIAIFLARFMPIIRTFSPFVAATSDYDYRTFLKYNVSAALCWVALCCGGGYFFGNIPFVKAHFSLVVIGIIVISLIPALVGVLKSSRQVSE
ncbi:membrane-associated protein [Secundilactobacillus odoratitofui DSM 19909 = JCM 15043]|uniref:Membrane-associated protein n=1 Tax=Secundilactobacillus odoratitofui DSM 19909 = JCM 15043 TaxID=1423776 RepID=A0A0R1LP55_9LACO|nr:VTT domain-containing protein [Secundilactobacillus odoratitofui]KRK97272.1 membrane-associated protein [Secundilactobacillus odoratitofui DSM 19909 = JCM 15043]